DRRLVAEARTTAPRVVVVLTKVDLLTDAERAEVAEFLDRALREQFGMCVPVLSFSARVDTDRWVQQFRETVLQPVAGNAADARRSALILKLSAVCRASHGYLAVGLQSAERAQADRDQLRAAVLDEQVQAAVIRDELRLAREGIAAGVRPAFLDLLL